MGGCFSEGITATRCRGGGGKGETNDFTMMIEIC